MPRDRLNNSISRGTVNCCDSITWRSFAKSSWRLSSVTSPARMAAAELPCRMTSPAFHRQRAVLVLRARGHQFAIRHNMRPGMARHRVVQMLVGGDDHLPASLAQEAKGRFDLRSHVAGRKLPGLKVAFHF